MSVPAGFTGGALPVGIQIVGRHRDEWSVLQIAHAFEKAAKHGMRRPPT
jgi:amidase